MYAIVDIAGQQFKVEKDQKVFVHRLDTEVGSQVDFEKVLLIDTEKSVIVGEPVIKGALVTAKVLEHLKGDKVIVFKKKRRKGYKVRNGHRQFFTQIMIEGIFEKGEKSAKPKEDVKHVAEELPVKKAKQTEKPEPEVKETAPKAATSKKPAEKKADSIKTAVVKKETIKKQAETKAVTKKEAKPKKVTVAKKAAPAKKTEASAAQKKAKKVDKSDKK